MSSHPLYWLLFVTLLIVVAIAGWSLMSTAAHQKSGGKGASSGLGGPHDPMA
jgi:hypothetical protein